ncbi:MAG: class II D-tagatose-bisphosphate aldolase, non-catalytic subunit [Acidobacteriaceae bacterium]|nr:class II D-tagatose-bisphosphate aldolase, non-catalytic subunit [Acidobacteriaceae bacterium]
MQTANATAELAETLRQNHQGQAVGVYSICSANSFVIEAGMLQAKRDGTFLLIESTSNQVNQFGGYTGQNPAQFVDSVKKISAAMNFPAARIIFGGDHLGPHAWRKENASGAMQKAIELVRACVLSGYTKIHLDTSMRLADDPGEPSGSPSDEVISSRAADLCRAAEEAYNQLPLGSPAPLYVIGTEVPIPGGELNDGQPPQLTRPEHAARTIDLANQAFRARGLERAWERVIGLVVQPGVEFGDHNVFPYIPEKARALADFVIGHWHGVYEAHSTDYQTEEALRNLVRDHFAILKVGPWLTFAFREAVFGLAMVEEEWLGNRKSVAISSVIEALEDAMLANPGYWKDYYQGDDAALRLARKYSFSDRCRYYWPQPDVAAAVERLVANLKASPAPPSLLSQFLPNQSLAVRKGAIPNDPVAIIHNKILEVLDQYAAACGITKAAGACH